MRADWGRPVRRELERLLALAGICLAGPALAVAAAAVWVEDGRPILYRQMRVGRNGRWFAILKIRSMRTAPGAAITASGDHRVTRVGRLIRKYKLDELPQLWNIVLGEMSFIGPRPESPEFVDMEDPRWKRILQVKPGITDWATLAYRNEEEILKSAGNPVEYYRTVLLPRKLAMNLQYLGKRTMAEDCKLLLLTVGCSFAPRLFAWKHTDAA